jgi:uncharacterized protein
MLAACEHRTEKTSDGAPDGDGAAAPATPLPAVQRCVVPTPERPSRPPPSSDGADPTCPPDPTGPLSFDRVKVAFPEANALTVEVEIARSPEELKRGLMYRTSLPEDQGMLFVLSVRSDHMFWMHNTCIPLDVVFADSDGLIVGIEENLPTMDDSPVHLGCSSQLVLGMNAGWARRHGVTAGQTLRIGG